LTAATLGAACKELLGTMVCMGVTCEEKEPRVVQQEIDKGKYNDLLAKHEN